MAKSGGGGGGGEAEKAMAMLGWLTRMRPAHALACAMGWGAALCVRVLYAGVHSAGEHGAA